MKEYLGGEKHFRHPQAHKYDEEGPQLHRKNSWDLINTDASEVRGRTTSDDLETETSESNGKASSAEE